MGGKDIIIPSAMWPLNGKTGIVLSHDNTVPCKDDGIRSVFDGMQFTVGGCYHNAFILREALRNAGYQADTYAGWLFVGDTIPAHHCVVILNEDTVLDPTVIDYRKMALDKLDKRSCCGLPQVHAGQAQKQLHHFRAGLARNDVLRIQMRSSCSTSDQSEAGKSIPEPPGVWPIYEGKSQTPIQEMIANAGISNF